MDSICNPWDQDGDGFEDFFVYAASEEVQVGIIGKAHEELRTFEFGRFDSLSGLAGLMRPLMRDLQFRQEMSMEMGMPTSCARCAFGTMDCDLYPYWAVRAFRHHTGLEWTCHKSGSPT
ncbi:MAG: hypothetical protein IPH10_02200 [bacterium]|nr:hypothetical protein [bacterium]